MAKDLRAPQDSNKTSRFPQESNKKKIEKSYSNNNYRQIPKEYDNVSRQTSDSRNPNIEKTLVENFVALQKVMTNLALSFDNLSSRITKLLDLFEASAKTLSEKDIEMPKTDKELGEKIDKLLEHNKVFAKGLSLLHEKEEPRSFLQKTSEEEENKNHMGEELRRFDKNTSGEELRRFDKNTSGEELRRFDKNTSGEELRSFPRKTSEEPQMAPELKPLSSLPRSPPQPPQQIQRRTDADGYQRSMSQNS